jgi:large subunit ribosomal protein L3
MPKRTRPRRGSLQYWPRTRAKRIFPRFRIPSSNEIKIEGFAGWKAGMSHVQYTDTNSKSPTYGKTITSSVTILDVPELFVAGIKYYANTAEGKKSMGQVLAKLPKDIEKNIKAGSSKNIDRGKASDARLIVATQPTKSGMAKRKSDIFELPLSGADTKKKIEYAESLLGKEISAKDIFRVGEYIDVSAVTKGHGYKGPVKRYGIRIQTRKDKQMHRHVGSLGPTTPRRVMWQVPQAGQYGFFSRTEYNKRIILVGDDPKTITPKGGFLGYGLVPKSFIVVEGSVPGHKKRLVMMRKSVRAKAFQPVELSYISLESKQGA